MMDDGTEREKLLRARHEILEVLMNRPRSSAGINDRKMASYE